jgi:2-polyprenyl-3-methyl-5-hydroxy-6-metoxy-1,4-benzoquinol methylase
MDLRERRQRASEASGGISSEPIKSLVLACLEKERAAGRLLDFGAGRAELLTRLHQSGGFSSLAGADLFPRPADLPDSIEWHQQDLNEPISIAPLFDVVVCSETIEHLENPRLTMRTLHGLLKPGGLLVLTMPSQESLRSYLALMLKGHFVQFLGQSYPAHITALLRMDLERICAETGFARPAFSYTGEGGLPRLPVVTWQTISFGLLKGRLFSDNLAMVTRRRS